MKKRTALIIPFLILALVLTACSKPAVVTPDDPDAGPPDGGTVRVDFLLDLLGFGRAEVLKSHGQPAYEQNNGSTLSYENKEDQYLFEFSLLNGTVGAVTVSGTAESNVSLACIPLGATEEEARASLDLGSASGNTITWDYQGGLKVKAELDPENGRVSTITVSDPNLAGLSAYASETIRGKSIDYGQCLAVVVENYEGANLEALTEVSFENPAYPSKPWVYYQFAVMGMITDVQVTSIAHMGAEAKTYLLADEISDSIVSVRSSFPSDMSVDRISFVGPDGESYQFSVDDVSGEHAVVIIK